MARTIPSLTDAIPEGMYKVADSQVASRWGNITEFRGFDLITPNEREAGLRSATRIPASDRWRRISMTLPSARR